MHLSEGEGVITQLLIFPRAHRSPTLTGGITRETSSFLLFTEFLDYSMENLYQSQDLVARSGFLSTPNYPLMDLHRI